MKLDQYRDCLFYKTSQVPKKRERTITPIITKSIAKINLKSRSLVRLYVALYFLQTKVFFNLTFISIRRLLL